MSKSSLSCCDCKEELDTLKKVLEKKDEYIQQANKFGDLIIAKNDEMRVYGLQVVESAKETEKLYKEQYKLISSLVLSLCYNV